MANPYLWITVVGGIFAFLVGCGVGMNDLANAFGTTYGARILTLRQIVLVAAICEFAGAVSLGAEVSSTISGGIADPDMFADDPYVLMYGMLCALCSAFTWLLTATMLSLPVSSTHSIAGGILGFALVYGGAGAVSWAKTTDEFPFVTGVAPIIVSWFISPLFTGIAASILYGSIRFFVMRPSNCAQRALYAIPFVFALAFFLESFFVLFKGAKARLEWSFGKALWVAAVIGVGAGIISIAIIPIVRRRVERMTERAARLAEEQGRRVEDVERDLAGGAGNEPTCAEDEAAAKAEECDRPSETFTGAIVGDGEGASDAVPPEQPREDKHVFDVEIYDPRAELVFRYLQVFTAICASFAHGASDVSNAIGPFAAIYSIYDKKEVSSKNEIHIWILCLGGGGLVLGLATLGVRLMRLLGERITKITPSRGFSAELAAALVVSFASGFGVPVSSTHCITGAVVAISMMDVGFCKVRWIMVAKLYGGWVCTLIVTGAISAVFFAQGIYAPGYSKTPQNATISTLSTDFFVA